MSDQQVYLIAHYDESKTIGSGEGAVRFADYYKIGVAEHPKRRLDYMKVGTPHELELLTVIDTDDADRVESALHRYYEALNHRAEWFMLGHLAINSLHALDQIRAENMERLAENVGYERGSTRKRGLYVNLMEQREVAR